MYNFYKQKLMQRLRCVAKLLLIMKLTTFLLIVSIMQVSAVSMAQKITLKERNASLTDVFSRIKVQTGYDFVFNASTLKGAKKVTIDAKDAQLMDVLNQIFEGQSLTFTINDHLVVVKPKVPSFLDKLKEAFAIPIRVDGRVTDSSGMALPGASIKIKDKVVKTDSEGRFSFSAEPGTEVITSFVGYKPYSFKVSQDMGFQNIVLKAAGQLEEVIVNTGYQRISKERATGSFDFIDNKKFNEQVGANVLDRLEGIANSLNVDRRQINTGSGKTGITIRGINTVQGQKDPLIVVDNFPYDGDINNINPNNVESITVLKDAAASSIWGARAGNGVIVITTKKGKFGQKMTVSANANISVVYKPDLFALKQISSSDFIDFEKILFGKGYYDQYEQDTYSRPGLSPVVELLIQARDHTITPSAADARINSMKQYDVRNDFNKYIYQKGVNQQYSLNVNGGTNAVAYNLSAGYDKSISNLDAMSQRINLTSLNTFRPLKNLEITAGINFTQSNGKNGKTGYGNVKGNGYGQLPVYTRLVDEKGNAIPVYPDYRQPFIDTLGRGQLLDWRLYPLDDYKHTVNNIDPIDLTLNASVAYHLLPSLKVSFNYQYEKQKTSNISINDMDSYYTRDLINRFTQLFQDGTPSIYPVPKGNMESMEVRNLSSNQLRGQLDFNKSWGQNSITALVGGELRSAELNNYSNMMYGVDPNTSTVSIVDYANFYPNIINASGQQIPYSPTIEKKENRFVSAYANAAYTYADKYTLSGSMRKDGSNIFGATTNNKWKPLWSTGVSWNLSKEAFYHFSAIPYLKLRATYGYSGNLGGDLAGVTTIYYTGTNPFFNTPQGAFNSYNNPDLRWENVGQTNIGIDFATKKNIISGSIEYYYKKCTDLYGPSRVDYTNIPVAYLNKNVGSIASKGIDVQLLTTNINRKLKWTTNWSFSWNTDRVISYYAGDTTARGIVGRSSLSHGGTNAVHGVYSYQWAGLNPQTGEPQGYLNGQVSTDYYAIGQSSFKNAVYNGPANPIFFGFIDNTFSWNNISLTVNILFKAGYYFEKPSIDYTTLAISGNGSADYAKRWQKPGDELHTNVPALIYPFNNDSQAFYNGSNVLVEKGDNIRLNYVRLNYAVPHRLLSTIGLSALNLYINAQNLGIIWRANKDGIDPDYQTDFQSLKPSKVLSIGLTTSF